MKYQSISPRITGEAKRVKPAAPGNQDSRFPFEANPSVINKSIHQQPGR